MDTSFLSATILLVLITDPLGNIPFFISALRKVRPERRRIVVVRECLIAFAALLLFLVAGRPILRVLHLSEDALRVSGGVVLLLIAIRMIFPEHGARLGEDEASAAEPFIVPVAIPLVAGPSAMATVLLMSTPDPVRMLSLAGSLTVTIAITAVVFVSSTRIQKVLGDQAITALERLMGLVLTAICGGDAPRRGRELHPARAGLIEFPVMQPKLSESEGVRLLREEFEKAGLSIREGEPFEVAGTVLSLDGYDPDDASGSSSSRRRPGDRKSFGEDVVAALERKMERGRGLPPPRRRVGRRGRRGAGASRPAASSTSSGRAGCCRDLPRADFRARAAAQLTELREE